MCWWILFRLDIDIEWFLKWMNVIIECWFNDNRTLDLIQLFISIGEYRSAHLLSEFSPGWNVQLQINLSTQMRMDDDGWHTQRDVDDSQSSVKQPWQFLPVGDVISHSASNCTGGLLSFPPRVCIAGFSLSVISKISVTLTWNNTIDRDNWFNLCSNRMHAVNIVDFVIQKQFYLIVFVHIIVGVDGFLMWRHTQYMIEIVNIAVVWCGQCIGLFSIGRFDSRRGCRLMILIYDQIHFRWTMCEHVFVWCFTTVIRKSYLTW